MPCATLPTGLPVKEDRHVKETKDNEKHGHFVDAGRAESEIFESDPEVAEVFESDKHGHGARSGGQQMMREIGEQSGYSRELSGGDMDADVIDTEFVGDEAIGGDNPSPDQDIVDEIGLAAGLAYEDNEPLRTTEKVEERDKHRWELDPASAEDYQDRMRHKKD